MPPFQQARIEKKEKPYCSLKVPQVCVYFHTYPSHNGNIGGLDSIYTLYRYMSGPYMYFLYRHYGGTFTDRTRTRELAR